MVTPLVLTLLAALPPVLEPVGKLAVFGQVTGAELGAIDLERLHAELRERYLLQVIIPDDERIFARAFDCGSDSACFGDVLRRVGADRGLRIVVAMGAEPALYSLEMVSTDGRPLGRVAGAWTGQMSLDDELVLKLSSLCDQLGLVRHHRVRVRVEPPEATVLTRPATLRARDGGHDFYAANGRYEVIAQLAGHRESRTSVSVHGGEGAVELQLKPESSEASGWLAIGVAVLAVAGGALVAGLVSSAAQGAGGRCICLTSDGSACPECAP